MSHTANGDVAREADASRHELTLTRNGPDPAEHRLVVLTEDPETWIISTRSRLGLEDAPLLVRALREEAPGGVELLLWDTEPGDALDAVARTGGWAPRARKIFVERDLADLDPTPDPVTVSWTLTSLAELGVVDFAQRMVRAAEGDPFDVSTPESAADDLQELIDGAGSNFDPTWWVVASDAGGDIGVVLPSPSPDAPGEGGLSYVGVVPHRRGEGHGHRLHLLGLQRLHQLGVRRYVGSTDELNVPMLRTFRRNGAVSSHTQTFYAAPAEGG